MAGNLTLPFFVTIIEISVNTRFGDYEGRAHMIRKVIIIAILAAIAYGVFRWMDASGFFGTRGKSRQTFEDIQEKALE